MRDAEAMSEMLHIRADWPRAFEVVACVFVVEARLWASWSPSLLILFGAITPIVKLTWSSRPIVISMSVISKIAGPTLFITQVLAFDKLAVLLL